MGEDTSDAQVRQRNLSSVERFYQAERDRDLDVWTALWRPDGRQTFPSLGPTAAVEGSDALREVTRKKFETRPKFQIALETAPFADPAQVLARLVVSFPDLAPAPIWCIFHFDADGLVSEVEELFDSGPYLSAATTG